MIKIRIEDTDINETFEYEGDGIVFAIPHNEIGEICVMTGVIGKFNKRTLKKAYESVKNVVRSANKGEGRIE